MESRIRELVSNEKYMQFMRFVLNGIFVTAIQYGVYLLLQMYIGVNIAYTLGYLVSFAVNFIMTSRFTFRQPMSMRRFLGFSGSHAVNYCVQMGLFNLFLLLGMGRAVAPIPSMAIAVLIQFSILRVVYRKRA